MISHVICILFILLSASCYRMIPVWQNRILNPLCDNVVVYINISIITLGKKNLLHMHIIKK